MRSRAPRAWALLALLPALLGAGAPAERALDPDRDGDGLSDFQELHKHRTRPDAADSDGDGIPDGDWSERREFTYTIQTRIRVVPPVSVGFEDDYQDARVLGRGEGWVELEAVHYPLGTAADAIEADPGWRESARAWEPYARSTTTSRVSAEMRRTLREELRARGIDPETADDRTLAAETARLLLERASPQDHFTAFSTDFFLGRPFVPAELRAAVRHRGGASFSLREQWERDLFADSMFERRVRGSCTSTAIYLAGGLRAVGLPARLVLAIPAVDPADPAQIALAERGIRHPAVRAAVLAGLRRLPPVWTSHTFNEVLVGGRWRRLDEARLGQPALDPGLFGLTTRILTVRDWADAEMARTVGRRQELGLRDELFPTVNPYRALDVRDEFGIHARIDVPAADDAPAGRVRLTRAFWASSPERPAHLGVSGIDLAADRRHIFLAAQADDLSLPPEALRGFWEAAPKGFQLESPAGAIIPAQAVRGYWFGSSAGSPYLYFLLEIQEPDRAKMRAGEVYRVAPVETDAAHRFVAEGALSVVAPGSAPE